MGKLARWYRGEHFTEERQRLYAEMDRRDAEKGMELQRQLIELGLDPGRTFIWALARADVGIFSGRDISLYAIDCPTCAALVRLDAWREHERWHDGSSR